MTIGNSSSDDGVTTANRFGRPEEIELYCPACDKSFHGELVHCPDDGSRLVRLSEVKDPLIGRNLEGRFLIKERLGATEDQRNAWLQQEGLWDKFYGHNEVTRQQIVEGDVRLGWSRDMVYMAWGAPFQKMRLTGRPAARSEELIYRFEVDKDGFATPLVGKHTDHKAVDRYQVELVIDDDTLTEMVEKDDWE